MTPPRPCRRHGIARCPQCVGQAVALNLKQVRARRIIAASAAARRAWKAAHP